MNDHEAMTAAEHFLRERRIGFVSPAIGCTPRSPDLVEIVFHVADALKPDVVVDPPDVRVIVNKRLRTAELIDQM